MIKDKRRDFTISNSSEPSHKTIQPAPNFPVEIERPEASNISGSTNDPEGRMHFLTKVASLIGLAAVAMPSLGRARMEAVADGRSSSEVGFIGGLPEFDPD